MKILHTADLHLASAMKTELSSDAAIARRNELTETFSRMIEYAASNGIEAFIIAGDLFDTGRVPMKTLRYITDLIADHAGITFYYLCGNHEGNNLGRMLPYVPDNLILFGDEWSYHRQRNVVFCGKENPDVHMYSSLELDPSDFNIVILHGQESLTSSGAADAISLPRFAGKSIDYLALGHLHTFRVRAIDDRGMACYPGCPEGRGFDECGEKGFVVIDTKSKKSEMINFVPFAKRQLHDVHVRLTPADIALSDIEKKILEKVSDIPKIDMVKIVLDGETTTDSDKDVRFLEDKLSDHFYFARVRDCTKLYIDPADYVGDISLKGELIRTLTSLGLDDSLSRDAAIAAISALKGEDIE